MRRELMKKDTFDQELGRRIRAHRLRLGYSQEKLGAMLGLTFQQVQKYEKGTNRVSSGRLIEIGHARPDREAGLPRRAGVLRADGRIAA